MSNVTNNEEALNALDEFIETASRAVQVGMWARAFLQEGGEPTWDSVKDVSRIASTLGGQAQRIAEFEEIFEQISPF